VITMWTGMEAHGLMPSQKSGDSERTGSKLRKVDLKLITLIRIRPYLILSIHICFMLLILHSTGFNWDYSNSDVHSLQLII
jgi:hypothetical protein